MERPEQKRIKEILNDKIRELDFYHDIFNSIFDVGIAVIDRNYCFRMANKWYLEEYKLSETDIIGKSVAELMGDTFFKNVVKPCIDITLGGQISFYETWFDFPKKGKRFVKVDCYPLKDERQLVYLAAIVIHDTTERKQAESRLQQSNDLLRAIIEAAPIAIIGLDLDGRVHTVWNAAAEKMLGWSAHEVMGRFLPSVPIENEEEFRGFREKIRRGMTLDGVEVRRQKRDGTPIDYSIYASPLHDAEGNITGNIAVLVDITERKKIEEAFRFASAYNRSLIETSLDPLVTIGPEGKITDVNAASEKATGCSRQELIGRNFSDFFTEPDKAEAGYQEVFRRGFVQDYPLEIKHKDGRRIPVLYNASVYRDEKGSIIGVFAAARDITERKKMKENLIRQRAIVDAINKVFLEALKSKTDEEVARACLAVAEELTGSKFGFIGEVNQLTGLFDTIAMSNPGWDECKKMPKSDAVVMIKDMKMRGIWAKVIKDEQSLIINDPASHPERVGTPVGHPPLNSFLGVPLRHAGKTFGMIALANKESGYDETDKQDIETLSIAFVEALNRKRIEELLRESEEKYRSLVEKANDGITIVQDKILKYVNPCLAEMLDMTPEELIGAPFSDYIYPDELPKIVERYQQRMAGEDVPAIYETVIIKKDKTKVFAEFNANIITYKGRPADFVIVRDITERRRAAEEIKREKDFSEVLFNTAQVIILVLDTEACIVKFNSYMEEISGYRLEEVKGKNWFDTFLPKENCVQIKEVFKKALCNISTKGNINPIVTKDGRKVLTEWYDKTLKDKDGKVIGLISIGQDITERKKIEEALRKSEERYRSIFENSMDAIAISTKEGRFVDFNQAMLNMLGYDREEIRKIHVRQLYVDPDGRNKLLQEIEQKGFIKDYEVRLRKKNGTEIACLMTSSLRRADDGSIIGYESVVRDITEKQRKENELLKAEKLETTSVLSGGIAHDFNNILTVILGNINLATMQVESGNEVFEKLITAEKACLKAKDLTQQLLSFTKAEAPVRKTISIGKLIKDSVIFSLRGSNVKAEISIPYDLWPVEADEGQISRVIDNITINAVQAMPQGGVIKVYAENITVGGKNGLSLEHKDYVRISIKDQGVGIPEEHIKKIFDPYFTTKHKGSGLGLTSAYFIVKRHDGHIGVESKIDNGATFHIYLPASSKEAAKKEEAVEEKVIREKPSVGKIRILVMDDEEMVRAVIGEMLRYLGYEFEFAIDGAEAISLYKEARESGNPFNIVIMDLTIPGGMGGKEAVKGLLEIEPRVKVIASSGYSNDPIRSHFKDYGFIDFIAKPYKIDELTEVLNRAFLVSSE